MRLWDSSTYQLTAAYTARDAVGAIQFDPSGRTLIVADIARRPNVYALEIVVPFST